MHANEIIGFPRLTEKANQLKDEVNQYTFKVHLKADKHSIKEAIEKAFEVEVESVRTLTQIGKVRRRGAFITRRPKGKFKKAIIQLKKGQKLSIFDAE